MRNTIVIALAIFAFLSCRQEEVQDSVSLEIKDNWYYLNGEKFFIKGIGYEIGARPGQNPYEDSNLDIELMRHDLKLLKEAGFNTIRTWSELTESQLKVVQESGLKIIFGIWILPHGEFADAEFRKAAEEQVRSTIAYTKDYNCIISYLILNEPMTDHIYKNGGDVFYNFFTGLKEIIHAGDPGVPVSISFSAVNSEYINQNMMDFYAINNYNYGKRQHATMGYRGFLEWCVELNGFKKPYISTEFGYAVSPIGEGGYKSSGNTLEQQAHGVLSNYRDVIDAGATGACPFYYADGWWKGGEKSIHNPDKKEEWYGFFGYRSLSDTIGSPRPVWYRLRTYMKALVLSPKNENIYQRKIPIELYLDRDIKKYVVKLNDQVLLSKNVLQEGYLKDSVAYNPDGKEAAELVFEFFDDEDELVKYEVITALLVGSAIDLPVLSIETTPEINLSDSEMMNMKIRLSNLGDFEIASDLKYNFNFHLKWDEGIAGTIKIPEEDRKSQELFFEKTVSIPDTCRISVPSAGITVRYNKYHKRISDKRILVKDYWTGKMGVSAIQPKE